MQELMTIETMTSMQISEATGKQHAHIMRDIRDESEKLKAGGISNESKFGLVEYTDIKGERRPFYELSKEGVLQLAARYDAVTRAKLIKLALKSEKINPYLCLSPELQAIFAIDQKQQVMESRVEKLENTMTIDYSQQEELRQLGNKTVVNVLCGKGSTAYKMIGKKAFAELWRHLKRSMNVNSYRNIATVDFQKAKEVILNWKPDKELGLMIIGANTQTGCNI